MAASQLVPQKAQATLRQRMLESLNETSAPGAKVDAGRTRISNISRESARVFFIQELWGEGFSSPGDWDYLLEMLAPLKLSPSMNVVEVGAGLGGASRLMAEHFGVRVTAFESDQALAEAGMQLCSATGLAKRARITVFDPDDFRSEEQSFDCAYSKEFLYAVRSKNELLRRLGNSLKSGGQFLFTDFVKPEEISNGDDLFEWIRTEPETPNVWSLKDYDIALSRLKINIRKATDITKAFRARVIDGWFNYAQKASQTGLDKELVGTVATDVELWASRVKAIDSGELQVLQVLCQKEKTALLSDW
ncbi:cyclopropane-fatty-acyl-phospholipid synthase family protein [Pelagibius sp. Alg239-R121]|uniref:SAM-dependent methyltransferase n=1 Tax=Pelagibius sp. Alg239-R121 TaxID=2993448 RepID=UPI0024A7678A|nr:methyltransferase domain-containing protein [Pelagibius sp. Alg239-R121]